MYWLVENKEQLNVLINSGYKKAFIEVISHNDTIHPVQNHVSLVYIRPIEASKGFIVIKRKYYIIFQTKLFMI